MDETFELLTLMQTGKSDLNPVVLLEAPGGTYWSDWRRFIDGSLGGRGLISEEDTQLFCSTDSVENAVNEIERFYRNYQSVRYVRGTLVVRLLRLPPKKVLGQLAEQFADVLDKPEIRVVEPSPQELAEDDALDCKRIALSFNQRDNGRLRQLIDELNQF
jgi:hypothetical protein